MLCLCVRIVDTRRTNMQCGVLVLCDSITLLYYHKVCKNTLKYSICNWNFMGFDVTYIYTHFFAEFVELSDEKLVTTLIDNLLYK